MPHGSPGCLTDALRCMVWTAAEPLGEVHVCRDIATMEGVAHTKLREHLQLPRPTLFWQKIEMEARETRSCSSSA